MRYLPLQNLAGEQKTVPKFAPAQCPALQIAYAYPERDESDRRRTLIYVMGSGSYRLYEQVMDNRLPNILQAVFFALTLVIACVAHSAAQGAMASAKPGVFTMVICSGYGAVTVSVDASGRPVEPPQSDATAYCPACMFNADASPRLPAPVTFTQVIARHAGYREPDTVPAPAKALLHPARGPPNAS